jgi:hypothetical protein
MSLNVTRVTDFAKEFLEKEQSISQLGVWG